MQQKEELIRTHSASICRAERTTTVSPSNIPNSLSCWDSRRWWPGAWTRGHPTAPVQGQDHGCTVREFLGQVSGAGSAVARSRLPSASGCGGDSPDGSAAGTRLPRAMHPAVHPFNPRPGSWLMGTRGIKIPQNQGVEGVCWALPRHPRQRFVVWHTGPGQVSAHVPQPALRGCVCPEE